MSPPPYVTLTNYPQLRRLFLPHHILGNPFLKAHLDPEELAKLNLVEINAAGHIEECRELAATKFLTDTDISDLDRSVSIWIKPEDSGNADMIMAFAVIAILPSLCTAPADFIPLTGAGLDQAWHSTSINMVHKIMKRGSKQTKRASDACI